MRRCDIGRTLGGIGAAGVVRVAGRESYYDNKGDPHGKGQRRI